MSKKKPAEKKPCFDLSLLLKSYEELPEFEFDFTLDYTPEHFDWKELDLSTFETDKKVSPDS